jgi:hypothetical protein
MPVAFYAAWLPRSFTLSTIELLNRFVELLTDYRSIEAIDGDMEPVLLFALELRRV